MCETGGNNYRGTSTWYFFPYFYRNSNNNLLSRFVDDNNLVKRFTIGMDMNIFFSLIVDLSKDKLFSDVWNFFSLFFSFNYFIYPHRGYKKICPNAQMHLPDFHSFPLSLSLIRWFSILILHAHQYGKIEPWYSF